jgi:hypothetical protein
VTISARATHTAELYTAYALAFTILLRPTLKMKMLFLIDEK